MASISGYGQTGPWVGRRGVLAPVVGAETGFTKAQGDAAGRLHSNDPHSNADVYTGMECAAGGARRAVPARAHRVWRLDRHLDGPDDVYVNEHVHDHLWDRPAPPTGSASSCSGDYPVLTAANGEGRS